MNNGGLSQLARLRVGRVRRTASSGAAPPAAGRSAAPAGAKSGLRIAGLEWPAAVFLLALIVPFIFQLGGLRLSAYRIVLIVAIIPLLVAWLSGRTGRIRLPDIALFLFWFWSSLSFVIVHDLGPTLEANGILFIETMGAYLLGRLYVRNADEFRAMVRFMFRIIVCMLPFAIYETLTAKNLLMDLASSIGTVVGEESKEPRWGLDRVQGPLDHPILFGVFVGCMISLVYMVLGFGRRWLRRVTVTAMTGFTAALSLSSGPLAAMLAQVMLLGWDGMFRRIRQRWLILALGMGACVAFVEIFSNRSTPEVFISYAAFDTHTAYNRIRIWQYGSASVIEHPVVGIGLNEWERPWHMSGSMDMFWLVPAVRHGLPAGLLLQLAVFSIFLPLAFRRGLPERIAWYRSGYLMCLVGFYIAGWTVHYWNTTYVHFLFILGSGIWMLDYRPRQPATQSRPRRRRTHRAERSVS